MLTRIKSFFSGIFRGYDDEPQYRRIYTGVIYGTPLDGPLLSVAQQGPINAPTGPAKDYADDPKEESLRQAFITPKPRKYIWWDKKRKMWRVRIKGKHLGYYPTLSLAVKTRNAYCKGAGIKTGRGE